MRPIQRVLVMAILGTPYFGDGQQSCPTFYSLWNGSCYHASTSSFFTSSRSRAEELCQYSGAHLVSIHNDLERQHVSSMISGTRDSWIGLTKTNDTWAWMDGSYVDYGTGDLVTDPLLETGCIRISISSGYAWQWEECETKLSYVCKLSLSSGVSDPNPSTDTNPRDRSFALIGSGVTIQSDLITELRTTRTVLKCAGQCLISENCWSFSYDSASGQCILLNGFAEESEQDYSASSNYYTKY